MSIEDRPRSARRAAWMRLRPGGALLAPALAGLAVVILGFAAVEVVLMIEGPAGPLWAVLLFPAYGLLYVGTGLLAWTRRPSNRMGALIVAGGFVWIVAGLPNAGIPALIAIGLIIATVPLAIVVHLLHAFPSGRLRGRASRVTVLAGYFVVLVLQAPVYLFGQGAGGPTTVLQIADRHDLAQIGHWVQWVAGAAVMVATAVILFGRLRRAAPARRRVLAPLDAYGILAVLFVPIGGIVVTSWFPEDGLELAVAQLTVMAGVPIAFVAAVLSGGFARTEEVQELGALLGAEEGRPALRAALRQVLGDDSLDLLFWVAADPPRWVDREGVGVELPRSDPERSVAEVRLGERLVGAIVYDATLIADHELVADAARVTALALDNERLTVELLASREGLRVSRTRLIEATDAERRRIARDLHDGLQTRLVLLAMQAGSAAPEDETAAELSRGLQEAIVELRQLVDGVVPASLTERGLYAAAAELTDRMPMPVELDFEPLPAELPIGVETAGYFVVSEAFSNVVKHSRAEELHLSITRPDGALRIEVVDNGVGGAHFGGGLRGLADRVDALSGRLVVESPPGGGTRILAEVPCG